MKKEAIGTNDNSFGILSVTLGILSIIFSLTILVGSLAGISLGILGIIFAIIQGKKNKNSWSKAGFWISLSGLIIGTVLLYLLVSGLIELIQQVKQLQASGAFDPAILANAK